MKERGMIFNAEMVRAILDGRKTQTRRIMKVNCMDICEKDDGSLWPWREDEENHGDYWYPCPFGDVGDRIWVRETFAYGTDFGETDVGCFYRATDPGWDDNDTGARWRPSIHMPRWASRITLEITGVRVERLASISDDDAGKEGYPADPAPYGGRMDKWLWFRQLWDSIYPDQSFKHNPWVWVITFRRVE
ncbi:hypothetical protein [Phytobacter diazotrophicus]|uniref:hypothetical protein n=1 Tax=Phytobacter diazotrophicus TaxID=395631 RepID=UPI002FFC742E